VKLLQTIFPASGRVIRPRYFWAAAALYWGSFGLVGYAHQAVYWLLQGTPGFSGTETLEIAVRTLLWLASTPLILYVAYRAPITTFRRPSQLARNLALHVIVQLLLNLLMTSVVYLLLYQLGGLTGGRTWGAGGIWASLLLRQSISLTMYLLLVFGYGVAVYAARNQQLQHQNTRIELASEQLKTQLAAAQLQALRMQLNPHFLFNAHHALIGLIIEQQNERAIAMITSLSDLLRAVLAKGDAQFISLREELQFVTKYLDIQQIRFEDRLHVEFNIAPEVQECLFPQFLLQPLVENAMIHGVEPVVGAAHLRIGARCEQERLVVEVSDNGPGALPRAVVARSAPAAAGGIGLQNTRARLEKLYHGQAQLEFRQPVTGGTTVVVRVPVSPLTSAVTTTL
jgi:sensor histidine kinase YesM